MFALFSLFVLIYGAWCCFGAEKRMRKKMYGEDPSPTQVRSSKIVGVLMMLYGVVDLVIILKDFL